MPYATNQGVHIYEVVYLLVADNGDGPLHRCLRHVNQTVRSAHLGGQA